MTTNTTNNIRTQAAAQWAKVDACYAEATNWIDLDNIESIDTTDKVEVDVEAKVAKIMKEAAEEMKAAPVSLVAVLDRTLIQWVDLKGATHGFWDAFGQAMKEQGIWR